MAGQKQSRAALSVTEVLLNFAEKGRVEEMGVWVCERNSSRATVAPRLS